VLIKFIPIYGINSHILKICINLEFFYKVFKLNDQACSEKNVEKLAEDGSIQNFNEYAYKPVNYKLYVDHTLPMQVPGIKSFQ
jgi:hypothetical protein